MKNLVFLCTFALASAQWTLVWNDEFEGTALNTTKWSYEVDCWGMDAFLHS
jgi:hypothetical protein